MKKYSVLLASLLAVVPFSVMASGVVVNPTVTFSNSSFLATNQSLPTNQLGNLVPLAAIDVT